MEGGAAVAPLAQLIAPLAVSAAPSPIMGLSALPAAAAWPSAALLVALAARSAARLAADRAPADPNVPGCSRTSRTGDAIHLAMAAGMAAMVMPLGVPSSLLIGFFAATTAVVAGAWLRRVVRRKVAARRGALVPCRPAHALEPHHVIIGLAMVLMAAGAGMTANTGMAGSGIAGSGMTAMPGMAASSHWLAVSTLALIYTWTAVVFLGGGLAKAAAAQPLPTSPVALLAAPVTVYTCELAMTVVMGLMLLG